MGLRRLLLFSVSMLMGSFLLGAATWALGATISRPQLTFVAPLLAAAFLGWAAHDLHLRYFLRYPAGDWIVPRELALGRTYAGPAVFGTVLGMGLVTAVPYGLLPGCILAAIALNQGIEADLAVSSAFMIGRLVPVLWAAARSVQGCMVNDVPRAAFNQRGNLALISATGLVTLCATTLGAIYTR